MADKKKLSGSKQSDKKEKLQDFKVSGNQAGGVKGGRRIIDDEDGPGTGNTPTGPLPP